jgi:ATP-dependent DNA helicase RecG
LVGTEPERMSEIVKQLKEGESETLEFKPSLSQMDKITESVSAFSNTNHKLGYEEIRNLALETSKIYWDEWVCEDASLEDIEEDKVRWYLERREEIRKDKKPEKMDIVSLLLNIGAAKKANSEIKPTNAGILFFGKNPQRFVLQSQLRLARFAGNELTRDFLDRLDCSGSLWEMVEGSEDFVIIYR